MDWAYVTIKLGDLTPWERNPKYITKKAAARLLALWQKLGQFQTIAIGPGGEVYDGHQRLSTLLAAYGPEYEVQALQAPRALTDLERAELVAQAHVGTVGRFDWQALSTWDAGALEEWGFDSETLAGWQQDAGELAGMVDVEAAPADGDERLTERAVGIAPRQMFHVLISVPVDDALELRAICDAATAIPGVEIEYGAN